MGQHRRSAPRTRPTVTVCIPTIPGRAQQFERAVKSALDQSWKPDRILFDRDNGRTGAAATRNRLIARVDTDLIAWLDDDDWFGERHIETAVRAFHSGPELDLVYTVPVMEPLTVREGNRYRPKCPAATTHHGVFPVEPWGLRWSQEMEQHLRVHGSFIPMAHTVRTEAVRRAGGFPQGGVLPDGRYQGEDERYLIALLDAGAVFHHVDRRTWHWFVNPKSTAGKGRPARASVGN